MEKVNCIGADFSQGIIYKLVALDRKCRVSSDFGFGTRILWHLDS
jgi:hypothetical protein